MRLLLLLAFGALPFVSTIAQSTSSKTEEECHIPLVMSDFKDDFGLFKKGDREIFYRLNKYIERKEKQLLDFQSTHYNSSASEILSNENLYDVYIDYYHLHRRHATKMKSDFTDTELCKIADLPFDNIRLQVLISELKNYNDRKLYGIYPVTYKGKDSTQKVATKYTSLSSVITIASNEKPTEIFKPVDLYYLTQNMVKDLNLLLSYLSRNSVTKNLKNTIKFSHGFYHMTAPNFDAIIQAMNEISINNLDKCAETKKLNVITLKKDIDDAKMLLEKSSNVERLEQEFKKTITMIVGGLIALILIFFFGGILYKSDNYVKEKLIGETGLQFITIFVIIIAVILFGIMNILKGSELAAILSAIAGYILGKTRPQESNNRHVVVDIESLTKLMKDKETKPEEKSKSE